MIEVANLTSFTVDKTFFAGVAKKVLKGENREMENVSIAFVSQLEIQKVNKKYRKKNKPTDVLSFPKNTHLKDEFAEVVICPAVVKKTLKKSQLSLKTALSEILIHGLLHVIGYDHEKSIKEEKRMFTKQAYYFSKLYIKAR